MSAIINPFAFGAFNPGGDGDLTMWVSADDPLLSGLSDGDPVGGTTPWTDRVTGTRTWANPTSGRRPVYKTNILNGKPVVRFDAIDDFLDFSVPGSNIFTTSAFTVFIVAKPGVNGTTLATEQTQNLISNFGFIGVNLFDSGGSTNKFRFYTYDGAYKGTNSTTTYSIGTWYIIECWYDGDVHIKVNNDTETSFDAGDPQTLGNTPRLSGNTATGSDIAEVLIYNISKSSGDRATLRNALASKYNITLA